MAINDRYKQFQPHQDNVQEIISAGDVNAIQDQVQANEQNTFEIRDQQFLEKCLFVLENHPTMNALWVDDLETTSNLDMSTFTGINYVGEESSLSLTDGTTDATVTTLAYTPGTGSPIQNMILMVEDYKPDNSSISYSVSNDGGKSWIPMIPNQSTPTAMPATGTALLIRARLQRTLATGDSPVVYAWALLYEDALYTPYIPDSMPTSTPFSTQPISHTSLVDVLPDQHHPQAHSHDGTDGSGRVFHKDLLGITEDDHHPKSISTAACLVRMIGSIFGVKLKEHFRSTISRLCYLLDCQAQQRFIGMTTAG